MSCSRRKNLQQSPVNIIISGNYGCFLNCERINKNYQFLFWITGTFEYLSVRQLTKYFPMMCDYISSTAYQNMCTMCSVLCITIFQYSSWWYGNLVMTLTMSLTWRFTRGINSIILPLPTYVCFSSCCLFGEYADIRHLSQNIQPLMLLICCPDYPKLKFPTENHAFVGMGGGGWGVDSTY